MAFTGNMSGMLIGEYILRERTKNHTMPENPAFVTTIVTTNLARAVAAKYGLHYVETLTGFKYIGEQIKLFEENHSYNYVFGLEESYGCLAGTHSRDKDAPDISHDEGHRGSRGNRGDDGRTPQESSDAVRRLEGRGVPRL